MECDEGSTVEAGHTPEAMQWYDRLLDVWSDSDPALVPIREQIRRQRDALLTAEPS